MKCDYNDCDGKNPYCEEKATRVLRLITIPQNECQKQLIYKRIIACEEHAEILCNSSEFKYENLPNIKPEDVSEEQLLREYNKKIKRKGDEE